ncbi:MAG: sulfurtransferase [Burkholderiaceae bacterium]
MKPVMNIAAYRFVTLTETARWREGIHSQAQALNLKGTVLLADEGINLVLAGHEAEVRRFLGWLGTSDAFAGIDVKESRSDEIPFARLVVKVKREIIRMNHPQVRPQTARAPALDARTLARWLTAGHDDAGREVVTLDTRNAFEIEHGRFRGAHDWRLAKFSDFPAALAARHTELAGKTVVSYCTGGIRCEKAALLMREAGLAHVWQLDGGILKYLEETDGAHFEGNCFVFDQREALDLALAPKVQV